MPKSKQLPFSFKVGRNGSTDSPVRPVRKRPGTRAAALHTQLDRFRVADYPGAGPHKR
jgi:hypothetical protein